MATDVITLLQPASSAPGSVPSISPVADPTSQAIRTSLRPTEYFNGGVVMGHYRAATTTALTVSIAANGILSQLFWLDVPGRTCIVTRIQACVEITGAITASTPLDLKATIFRGGTAVGSGGAALAATVGNTNKMKTQMEKSLLLTTGEIRTATTSALTGPTNSTLDTNPIGFVTFPMMLSTNVTGTVIIGQVATAWPLIDLYKADLYNHPIELASGEGVSVAAVTAGNVSGTVTYGFIWEWMEVGPSIL